jgi:hypothetical protein
MRPQFALSCTRSPRHQGRGCRGQLDPFTITKASAPGPASTVAAASLAVHGAEGGEGYSYIGAELVGRDRDDLQVLAAAVTACFSDALVTP